MELGRPLTGYEVDDPDRPPTMPANWTICEYCGSTIDQWDGCPTCD